MKLFSVNYRYERKNKASGQLQAGKGNSRQSDEEDILLSFQVNVVAENMIKAIELGIKHLVELGNEREWGYTTEGDWSVISANEMSHMLIIQEG